MFYTDCGEQNDEVLIMIHGLCGTSLLFYKILKRLTQKYHVICIDIMGMGRCSRPKFCAKTRQEAEDFFTDAVE